MGVVTSEVDAGRPSKNFVAVMVDLGNKLEGAPQQVDE